MHELAISRAVLKLLEDIARSHAATVRKVVVRIGPLSGVEPNLLARAYPIAAAGTPAEGSELVIETVDVTVRCRICGAVTPASVNRLLCGACGDCHTDLASGDEMTLRHVELTQPATADMV